MLYKQPTWYSGASAQGLEFNSRTAGCHYIKCTVGGVGFRRLSLATGQLGTTVASSKRFYHCGLWCCAIVHDAAASSHDSGGRHSGGGGGGAHGDNRRGGVGCAADGRAGTAVSQSRAAPPFAMPPARRRLPGTPAPWRCLTAGTGVLAVHAGLAPLSIPAQLRGQGVWVCACVCGG